jgi:Fic family protein
MATAIHSKWKEIFEYVPIESLIKKYQENYYNAINNCNNNGNSNEFIEFMLKMIDETLDKLLQDSQDINLNKKFDEKLDGLNNTERLALNFIAEKELVSTSEIEKYIEKTDRTARRIVAKLEEKGLITWEGLNENDSNKKYKLK